MSALWYTARQEKKKDLSECVADRCSAAMGGNQARLSIHRAGSTMFFALHCTHSPTPSCLLLLLLLLLLLGRVFLLLLVECPLPTPSSTVLAQFDCVGNPVSLCAHLLFPILITAGCRRRSGFLRKLDMHRDLELLAADGNLLVGGVKGSG